VRYVQVESALMNRMNGAGYRRSRMAATSIATPLHAHAHRIAHSSATARIHAHAFADVR